MGIFEGLVKESARTVLGEQALVNRLTPNLL
jgi:hypothetical protein